MSEIEPKYKNAGALLTLAGALTFLSAIIDKCSRKGIIISNILIFSGVFLILEEKFIKFFTKKNKVVASVIFLIGFLLVIINHNIIGALLELIGIGLMFGGFFPRLITTLRKVPYVGKYFRFSLPSWMYQNNEELPL